MQLHLGIALFRGWTAILEFASERAFLGLFVDGNFLETPSPYLHQPFVDGDANKPGIKPGISPETRQILIRLHEGVLHNLFGVLPAVSNPFSHPKHSRLIVLDELLKRGT
jgi:hypothetical protein